MSTRFRRDVHDTYVESHARKTSRVEEVIKANVQEATMIEGCGTHNTA